MTKLVRGLLALMMSWVLVTVTVAPAVTVSDELRPTTLPVASTISTT